MNGRTAKLLTRVGKRRHFRAAGIRDLKRRWNLIPRPQHAYERRLLEEDYPK